MFSLSHDSCIFCQIDPADWLNDNDLAFCIRDIYPVNQGHSLIIPKRHVASYFDLTPEEVMAMHELLQKQKAALDNEMRPDGWNIGVNVNHWGGQTVFHVHMHLIPRFDGDVADPRGGVRNIKAPLVPYPAETDNGGMSTPFSQCVKDDESNSIFEEVPHGQKDG